MRRLPRGTLASKLARQLRIGHGACLQNDLLMLDAVRRASGGLLGRSKVLMTPDMQGAPDLGARAPIPGGNLKLASGSSVAHRTHANRFLQVP